MRENWSGEREYWQGLSLPPFGNVGSGVLVAFRVGDNDSVLWLSFRGATDVLAPFDRVQGTDIAAVFEKGQGCVYSTQTEASIELIPEDDSFRLIVDHPTDHDCAALWITNEERLQLARAMRFIVS